MTVLRTGSNKQYAENWEKIFAGKKARSASKGPAKATTKKSAKKKKAAKKAGGKKAKKR